MRSRFDHNFRSAKFKKFVPFLIVLAPAFFLLVGALIMVLWNWLMVDILSLAAINVWKALGLLLLSRILFGSFHHDKHHKKIHSESDQRGYSDWWDKEGKEQFRKYREEKNQT